MKMHGRRNIERQDSRIWIAGGKLARAVARATARVNNETGHIFNVIEPRKHAVQHLMLQDSCLIIAGRGALERFAHLALIDYMIVAHVRSDLGKKSGHSRYKFTRMG